MPNTERVVDITGGRYDATGHVLKPSLAQLLAFWRVFSFGLQGTVLGHGNAIGTDQAVAEFFKARYPQVEIRPCPVDRKLDGPWPAAGHRRNGRMLREHKPVALVSFPGGKGTANCIKQALELEIPVFDWDTQMGKFRRL